MLKLQRPPCRQKIVERLDTKLGALDKGFLKFDQNR
jgi:hypothetical protein